MVLASSMNWQWLFFYLTNRAPRWAESVRKHFPSFLGTTMTGEEKSAFVQHYRARHSVVRFIYLYGYIRVPTRIYDNERPTECFLLLRKCALHCNITRCHVITNVVAHHWDLPGRKTALFKIYSKVAIVFRILLCTILNYASGFT